MPERPPQRRAIALRYQAGDRDVRRQANSQGTEGPRAPEVTATGAGLIADRIVAAAREAGVPVRSDPALAHALGALDLGREVPEAMYVAVAEALAWAYRVDAAAGERRR